MTQLLGAENYLCAATETLRVSQTRAEWGVYLTAGLGLAAMAVHVATHPLSDTSWWAFASYLAGFLMAVPLAAVAVERHG